LRQLDAKKVGKKKKKVKNKKDDSTSRKKSVEKNSRIGVVDNLDIYESEERGGGGVMDSILGGNEESGVGLFEEEEEEADEIGDILSSRTGNEVKVKQDHEIDDLEVREMLGEDEGEYGLFSSNRKVVTKEEEDIKKRRQQPAEKASLFQEVDSLEENLKRVDFGEDGG